MIADTVVERVQAIVCGIVGPHRTPVDAGPRTSLGEGGFWLDSIDLLEVIIACESEFGIVFDSATDLTKRTLSTLGSLADLVRNKLSA